MLLCFELFHILNVSTCFEFCNNLSYLLFLQISSDDGNSASGKTPDSAWVEFQKKGYNRVKIWHGKRLSSKMYGLEVEISDIDNSVFNVPDHFFYFSGKLYQNF